MFVVRRHRWWLIAAALACQIAGVAAAPLTFCCQNVATASDEEQCCPGLLPGQVCPMHHTREGVRTCKMRNACARSDAALVALAGGIGVLPSATPAVSAFDLGDPLHSLAQSALSRARRPESPPPRA